MVLEHRTPLMVASLYGSLDVMKLILSLSEEDVNRSCGPDKSTALHCAASGASVDAVKLLLATGANPNLTDGKGNRPYDVINVSRFLPQLRGALEELLNSGHRGLPDSLSILNFSDSKSGFNGFEAPSSPIASKANNEKKEYPIDPSIPDIKNSIYGTDEFRMYSFKVRPCSRAYSHDWTECPFVHPGENARRRDPRKYHYSCVPCPDFRKGSCRRGDMCEYAHGVFECWLHPAQYRTRLCKDGTSCDRRVCFFAHIPEELRPLYASTGSGVPSPRAAVMDMAAALNIFPGSPSAQSGISLSPFSSPISPSSAWQQQNMNMNVNMNIPPTLNLPGSNIHHANNIQTSRLRSSLNARDMDLELEQLHILNDMSCYSQSQFNSPSVRSKTMAPANLDELFSIEVSSSPRFSDQLSPFSPSHKSAMLNHFQQQQQNRLSPINTKAFSPKSGDYPMMQGAFGPSSPGMMSPRGMGDPQSPLNARLSAALAMREKQQQIRSLSARDLGAHLPRDLIPGSPGMTCSPVGSWPSGRPEWPMNGDEMNGLKRSYSTNGHNAGEEPDLSWVQSLVKDSPSENKELQNNNNISGANSNSQVESVEHSELGAWLDQIVAL